MKKILLLLTCFFISMGLAIAQNRQVTGIVVDDNNDPVIGASVEVKGTTIGTVTRMDGHFSLTVPSTANLIIVRYLGMDTVEEVIQSNMRITLSSSITGLDEVVIVAYGVAKKSSITGSTSVVSKQKIETGSREALDKALMGKVSGVRISSNTGDPGAAGETNIRGISSVSASSRPLYVIDGIAVDAGTDLSSTVKSSSLMATINPDDIESVTVLKDAAAASLYGSRAANGVILITTKKGKAGKTKVTYRGEFGRTKMAVKQFEMASGAGTIDYYREGAANYYLTFGEAATKAEAYDLVDSYGDLEYYFADPSGRTSTNWRDEVYRTANVQDHEVSISGGNDKTRFYLGFGYNDTEGIVTGSSFDRYSTRVNVDHNLNKYIDVAVKQSIAKLKQDGFRDQNEQEQGIGTSSPLGILFAMDPTAKVYNEDGSINQGAGWGKVSNPLSMLGGTGLYAEFVESETFRSITNGELLVKFMPELTFKSILGYDYTIAQHFEFWSPKSVNGENLHGMGSREDLTKTTLVSSNILRYETIFNNLHNFNAFVGFETEKINLLDVFAEAKNYASYKLPELANGQPSQASSAKYESTMLSYLANANYNYAEKYYVSGSYRRDGSSRLGEDNRWADFYSASLAWRISQEDFLKDSDLFTDLKFRASYGTNGNLPTNFYINQSMYAFTGGYGSESAIYWDQPGNKELGWEKSENFNIGFEWLMFDRFGLNVEYYNKTTSSLLFDNPTSYAYGYSQIMTNMGNIKNSGIEVDINTKNIRSKNFTWNTDFNFTWQKNEITELPDGADVQYGDGNMYLLREGESIHTFYLPVWKGVDPETGLGMFLIDPNDESKGVTNYYSRAGKTVVGKALPDFLGGMTNTFTYRDFDLSFLITYQYGGDMFDYPGYFANSDGVRIGTFGILKEVEGNYWKNPGDIVDNPKPIAWSNPYRSDRWSSRTILSTDNIRLRELSFGYKLPVSKIDVLKDCLSGVRFYAKANNLLMIWAKTKNVDPDVSLNGYRQVDTPVASSVVFGINVEF